MRPAVSTEYIENDEPAACRPTAPTTPTRETLGDTIERIVDNFQLQRPFDDLHRDADYVLAAMSGRLHQVKLRANFQIQVLSSLFYRNKGAYVVGKIINGFNEVPFALPILHNKQGKLLHRRLPVRRGRPADAVLASRAPTSWSTWKCPSAYVQFLRSLMPRKPRAEIYNALAWPSRARRCSTATSSTT